MPYVLMAEKKKYAWCACGESENQPFCDGSHKGSGFSPIIVDNEKDKNILRQRSIYGMDQFNRNLERFNEPFFFQRSQMNMVAAF